MLSWRRLREFVVLFSISFKFTLQTEANCSFFFFFLSREAVNIKNKSESPTETSFYFILFFNRSILWTKTNMWGLVPDQQKHML